MFWIPSQREAVFVGQESVTIECHSEAFPKSINYWVNSKGAMLQSSKSLSIHYPAVCGHVWSLSPHYNCNETFVMITMIMF